MKTMLIRNSKRIFIGVLAGLMSMSMLLVVSTITTAAGTIKFEYKKNMPNDWWTADTSVELTQSTTDNRRYYGTFTFDANSTYGCYIKDGDTYVKANVTASNDSAVQLYSYGNNNADRVTYTTGTATDYAVTYDSTDKKLFISPLESSTCVLHYDVATDHDNYWDLTPTVTLSYDSNGDYSGYLYLTGNTKYYMYMYVGNQYYKAATNLAVDNVNTTAVTLHHYSSNNVDKVNFTPNTGGYYKFTWSHREKIIYLTKQALPYSNKTFKISDGITDKWDDQATNTMSGNGTSRTFTYYLKKSDNDVYFRFYNSSDSQIFGAETSNQIVSTSYSSSTRTNIGPKNIFATISA